MTTNNALDNNLAFCTGLPVPSGLTTTGTPSATTFLNGSGVWISAISSINIQTFKTSGTYTPTSGMIYCIVEMVGGGGGGGGTPTASGSTGAAGGAGGSGAYSRGIFSAATIGASQTITIGSGGTVAANTTGGNGGTTSLGVLMTAPGGTGGLVGNALGVSIVYVGAFGANPGTGGYINTGGVPGELGALLLGGNIVSGNGGSSILGAGGLGVTGTNAAGNAALANSGSGGSGSIVFAVTGTTQPGGLGGSGIVLITEFIA